MTSPVQRLKYVGLDLLSSHRAVAVALTVTQALAKKYLLGIVKVLVF